jgi:hypothetical protein
MDFNNIIEKYNLQEIFENKNIFILDVNISSGIVEMYPAINYKNVAEKYYNLNLNDLHWTWNNFTSFKLALNHVLSIIRQDNADNILKYKDKIKIYKIPSSDRYFPCYKK